MHMQPRASTDPSPAIKQALAALQRGELQRAEQVLQEALQVSPQFDALLMLGVIYGQQGRFREAAAKFVAAAELRPGSADAHYNLALALGSLGEKDRALDCYRAALAANPAHLGAQANLAAELLALRRWEEARVCLERALASHAGHPQLLSNLGIALKELGRLEEAIGALCQAVGSQPNDPALQANLGLVLRQAGHLDEAIARFRQAVSLAPNVAAHHNHLGLTLSEAGQLDAAVESLRRAIALDPSAGEFHENLGMVLLLKGDLGEGWPEYDRRKDRLRRRQSAVDAPIWRGEPLAGRSILVRAEQGLGDTLQFVRYLPLLAEKGATVSFAVQPTLLPILQQMSRFATIVPAGETPARFDFQNDLLSLPIGFRTDLSNIPHDVPYLSVDGGLVSHWREKIGSAGLRIGICWQGSPTYEGDRGRSVPLREFAPLAQIPGVRLISLQKRFGEEQIAGVPFGERIETLGEGFDEQSGAFVDSAAAIMNLDLVVSSDTSIAHLAGALARPLFIALRRVPDWRWLMDRDDSPWYPTARLFRQQRAGDWADVFARIAAAVRAAIKQP